MLRSSLSTHLVPGKNHFSHEVLLGETNNQSPDSSRLNQRNLRFRAARVLPVVVPLDYNLDGSCFGMVSVLVLPGTSSVDMQRGKWWPFMNHSQKENKESTTSKSLPSTAGISSVLVVLIPWTRSPGSRGPCFLHVTKDRNTAAYQWRFCRS
jgi:hypothetical protein